MDEESLFLYESDMMPCPLPLLLPLLSLFTCLTKLTQNITELLDYRACYTTMSQCSTAL